MSGVFAVLALLWGVIAGELHGTHPSAAAAFVIGGLIWAVGAAQ